jgi:hypothetical protein
VVEQGSTALRWVVAAGRLEATSAGSERPMNMNMEQMHQHLMGMSFPASKQDLMNQAMQHGASNDEMEMIKKLPGENFNSMDDVKNAAMMMKSG